MKKYEKTLLFIGGSGHARVLIDSVLRDKGQIVGILDPKYPKGEIISGVEVLGGDEVITQFDRHSIELVNGLGVLPSKLRRWDIVKSYQESGYEFAKVVHPSAIVSDNVMLDSGVQVMAGCVLQDGVKVGRHTVINTGTTIDHGCVIGRECWLSPGVTICADVTVGPRTYVGAGAVVIQDITIQENVLVKAGTCVTNDLA